MPAQQQHFVSTAYLTGTTGPVPVGSVLCLTTTAAERYTLSTSANRAAFGRRSVGIALTAGDDDNPAVEMQSVGPVSASVTGLGVGAVSLIRVSSTGRLERTTSYSATDDVCGYCDADGAAYVMFPLVGIALQSLFPSTLRNSGTGTLTDVPSVDGSGNPVGCIELTGSAAVTLDSIAGGVDGRELVVLNRLSSGDDVRLFGSGGTVANRIRADVTIPVYGGAVLKYSTNGTGTTTDDGWIVAGYLGYVPRILGGTGLDLSDGALSGQGGKVVAVKATEDGMELVPGGGTTPTGTGFRHVTAGVEDGAAKLVENPDVAVNAGIAGSKISPDFAAQTIKTTDRIELGSSVASGGGFVRLPYAATATKHIQGKSGSSQNADIIAADTGTLTFGENTHGTWSNVQLVSGSNVQLRAGPSLGAIQIIAQGLHLAQVDTNACRLGRPVGGHNLASAPFRWLRAAITKSDATDLTLSSAQYECARLHVTGTPGGDFSIIAPNTTDAWFIVKNGTANVLTIKKSGGTGTPIPAGKTAAVWHNGTDYEHDTLDT